LKRRMAHPSAAKCIHLAALLYLPAAHTEQLGGHPVLWAPIRTSVGTTVLGHHMAEHMAHQLT
jgi:hypothetical protein